MDAAWRSRLLAVVFVMVTLGCSVGVSQAAATPAPADFFGSMAAGMLTSEEEAAEYQLLGVHTIRVNINWAQVDPSESGCEESGGLNWSYYDAVFRRAAEHGLSILADLYGNRIACGVHRFPNPGSANYKSFVFAESGGFAGGFVWQVVKRYGAGGSFWSENPSLPYHPVQVWEVWNEPNLAENNPGSAVQPQKYAKLLVDTAATIRAAQPSALVLLGGIYSGGGTTMSSYLTSIYGSPSEYTATQFHNAFDGVSIHPYAASGSGAGLTFGGPGISETRVVEDREVLNQPRSGLGGGSDAAKSLWVTEVGWPTEFAATPSLAAITPAIQSEYVTQTMSWLYSHAAEYNIQYAATFALADYHGNPGCSEPNCWPQYTGLKRIEFFSHPYLVDRPSRCALKGLISGNNCFTWNSDNLGGNVTADPEISSRGLGHVEVFARGTDERLYDKAWDQNHLWSEWSGLPGPSVTSGAGAVSWSEGRTDVVARIADGSIEHWGREGGSWEYENLGGNATSDPAITSWGVNRLDVFVRGTDNSLDHKSWDPVNHWSVWERLPGPLITSSPSAVSWSPGRLDVVARVEGGSIEHWGYESGTWGWENIGGDATSDPALASWTPNRLDVFVRGTDNSLDHQSWDPIYHWSGWERVPGPTITSGPGAVSWNPNRLDVVARVEGGTVQHWSWER